jgi:hypothetical protein
MVKELEVMRGKPTFVDDEDYDRVKGFKWGVKANDSVGASIENTILYLHRFIMDAKPGEVVIHKNGNKHDNRRENLELRCPRLEIVELNGEKFYRNPDSKRREDREYYHSANKRYHVALWEHHHGPVPSGYVIHHIDHNSLNNDISNLSCMLKGEHLSLHKKGRPHPRTKEHNDHLQKAVWTPERRAELSEKNRIRWAKQRAEAKEVICTFCGKTFKSPSGKAKCCSVRCYENKKKAAGARILRVRA